MSVMMAHRGGAMSNAAHPHAEAMAVSVAVSVSMAVPHAMAMSVSTHSKLIALNVPHGAMSGYAVHRHRSGLCLQLLLMWLLLQLLLLLQCWRRIICRRWWSKAGKLWRGAAILKLGRGCGGGGGGGAAGAAWIHLAAVGCG